MATPEWCREEPIVQRKVERGEGWRGVLGWVFVCRCVCRQDTRPEGMESVSQWRRFLALSLTSRRVLQCQCQCQCLRLDVTYRKQVVDIDRDLSLIERSRGSGRRAAAVMLVARRSHCVVSWEILGEQIPSYLLSTRRTGDRCPMQLRTAAKVTGERKAGDKTVRDVVLTASIW